MFEIFVDVGFGKINLVLAAAHAHFLKIIGHGLLIILFQIIGRKSQMFTRFQIHKPVGLVPEIEILFLPVIGHVKEQNFVFVVFQVLKGLKQLIGVFLFNQIAEKDHQRAFVNVFGNHVQGPDGIGLFVQLGLFLS